MAPLTIPGHRVVHLAETTSTNDVAREGLASGELSAGDVVVADRQSAGRGRRGRRWVTLPGRALAASVVVRVPPLPRPTGLAVLMAVAAARALDHCGARDIAIKWPNDLMQGEGKVGGLLIETVADDLAVVGLGVNLMAEPDDFASLDAPPLVPPTDAGLPADARDALAAAWVGQVDAVLAAVGTAAEDGWRREFRRRSWLTGRPLVARHRDTEVTGIVLDVTGDGDLLLADDVRLQGELVEILRVGTRPPPS